MLHSVVQYRLIVTVLSMLVLTGCSRTVHWFPSKQFTTEDWRRNPILSVTQQCVDDFVDTRTVDVMSLRNCAEFHITVAEF